MSDGEIILRDDSPGRWLRFREPVEILEVHDPAEVLAALRHLEAAARSRGLWAAGFLAYEAAPAFDRALPVLPPGPFPLLRFGLYPPPVEVDLPEPGEESTAPLDWTMASSREEYLAALASIQERIARGDTYQVNHTVRLRAPIPGGFDPWPLFLRLAREGRAGSSAWVDAGRWAIASASPELFFRRRGDEILARPMKGTAPRGRFPDEDDARARALRESEKDRAENVMIVDMVRNDLGRVAETGSVRVLRLFDLERYPTVWQLTSTVLARSRAPLSDLLAALFPCASVTGAPKPRTMGIITALEREPRRIYTGSIGYLAPDGDCRFNVAIRTVLVDREAGVAEYGAGGGIVWDSDPEAEWAEVRQKTRVLLERPARFDLLETMAWDPREGWFLLDLHLERLETSAGFLDIPADLPRIRDRLGALAGTFPPRPHRVRLLVGPGGEIRLEAAPLEVPGPAGPLRLELAPRPVPAGERLLFHKTTARGIYDEALAARPGTDDVVLWNERGEATETALGNLVVRLGGRRITPPVECGLLPGTFRRWLLERGEVTEAVVRLEDLPRCEGLWRINSVRRWQEAALQDSRRSTVDSRQRTV